jgi:hypothetical protein
VDTHEPSLAGLAHPEWVDGRRLWMDTPMRDLIQRIRFGDPVKGWEGDDRLAVYWDGATERFELWRLEDDETYRMVARSGPGIPFDERVIDALIGWDNRRRTVSLHDQVVRQNEQVDAERRSSSSEYMAEEVAPRLRHAIRKEL